MDRRTYLKHTLALSGSLLIPAGFMALVGRNGVTGSSDLVGFDGRIMGTGYSVRLGTPLDELDKSIRLVDRRASTHDPDSIDNHRLNLLANQVHKTLQKVDRSMSTWRDTSELSLFNKRLDKNWYKVNSATLNVIDHSIRVSDLSVGAFDLTIGRLVDLWGFGADVNNAHFESGHIMPSNKAVTKCMRYIGYNAVEIDYARSAIRKSISETKIDLSGVAKGFAVDKVSELLDAQGYENYLVEVGGELRARGQVSNNRDWRVAIERPSSVASDVLRVVPLQNSAIATSGDYRNFYVNGGDRYSHSIDPRTGRPVNHELVSVSVVADTTMLADAYSTALIIMGPEEAHAFAEQHQIAAHFVLKSATGKLDVQYSPLFSNYIT